VRAGLELPSLRRACPSFQNLTLCAIVPLNGEFMRNAQARSAVALRSSNPFEPSISFIIPFIFFSFLFLSLMCLRTGCIRVTLASLLYDPLAVIDPCGRRALLPPPSATHPPQRSLVISLRNSDMLPNLRKAQFKGPCGRLLLEQSQILPIDSGESPPSSLTGPLNFMRPR